MNYLHLASASPRRKQLLEQLGLHFSLCPVDADEDVLPGEAAHLYVQRLAELKACMAYDAFKQQWKALGGSHWVIGSDTSVVANDTILGKPKNREDFRNMMQCLSGSTHQVLTGISVLHVDMSLDAVTQRTECICTDVSFTKLSASEIELYWESDEPRDKAGGYGIQGLGALFVERIQGSYSNVVGLPLKELSNLLAKLGLDVWQARR